MALAADIKASVLLLKQTLAETLGTDVSQGIANPVHPAAFEVIRATDTNPVYYNFGRTAFEGPHSCQDSY